MRKSFKHAFFGTTLAILLLTSCAPPSSADRRHGKAESNLKVNDEDLKAARLLSLTNSGALDTISDPYDLAINCAMSIEALVDQLREQDVLTDEQTRTTQAAANFYRREAADSGKSPNEVSEEIERLRFETRDPDFQARAAVSCLKNLT